jgi:erythromycin esterase
MRTSILSLSIILYSLTLNAQDLKKIIQDNAHAISIDPFSTSFQDLEYLGKAIENKRIIILGEQEHGDGSSFAAKARLVKYLHEKLGYTVLIFESDMISMNEVWNQVTTNKKDLAQAISQNIYPVWTNCEQASTVFQYIVTEYQKGSTIKLGGFDSQITGVAAFKSLKSLLGDSLQKYNSTFYVNHSDFFKRQVDTALRLLNQSFTLGQMETKVFYQSFISSLSIIKDELFSFHSQISQSVESILSFYIQLLLRETDNDLKSSRERDAQMARNLKWLVSNKYPNEKIIVWAANTHVIKNNDTDINKKHKIPFSMGQNFTRDSSTAKQTYIIGFTGYSGISKRAFGNMPAINISNPKKNSLESWIKETGKDNVFINFQQFQKSEVAQQVFTMNFIVWVDAKSDWINAYDGIIYIQETVPCAKINQ